MAIINWNTQPDYDEWGVDTWWSCADWITWHKKLVEHFNKPTANDIWNYAFSKSGNLSGNLDCRTFNNTFREYVRENELSPYEGAGVFTPILQGYGTASDVLSGGLGSISEVSSGLFDGINSIAKGGNIKKAINIALIVGAVIGIAYVYKSFKK